MCVSGCLSVCLVCLVCPTRLVYSLYSTPLIHLSFHLELTRRFHLGNSVESATARTESVRSRRARSLPRGTGARTLLGPTPPIRRRRAKSCVPFSPLLPPFALP